MINRLQTGRQPLILFPHSVYIGFRLFVLLERCSADVSSMPWRVRGTLVSWANNSVGTQSCPTPPGRPAGRPDPTRPWYVQVLDSTGLHRISLVRASGETFKRYVLDALDLGGYEGGLFSGRTVLTDPAPSPRCALRPDPPVVCSRFGLDR